MMLEDFLNKLESKLPDLATSKDLVEMGLFGSEPSLCKARKKGNSPDYIEISPRKIVYPKDAVIKFFREKMKDGSKPKH